jgi:hypothetical protein
VETAILGLLRPQFFLRVSTRGQATADYRLNPAIRQCHEEKLPAKIWLGVHNSSGAR